MGRPKAGLRLARRTDLRCRGCRRRCATAASPGDGRGRCPSRGRARRGRRGGRRRGRSTIPTGRPVNCRRCWPASPPSTTPALEAIAVTLVDVPLVRACDRRGAGRGLADDRRADRPPAIGGAPRASGDLRSRHVRRATGGAARGRGQGGDRRASGRRCSICATDDAGGAARRRHARRLRGAARRRAALRAASADGLACPGAQRPVQHLDQPAAYRAGGGVEHRRGRRDRRDHRPSSSSVVPSPAPPGRSSSAVVSV